VRERFGGWIEVYVEAGTSVILEMGDEGSAEGGLGRGS